MSQDKNLKAWIIAFLKDNVGKTYTASQVKHNINQNYLMQYKEVAPFNSTLYEIRKTQNIDGYKLIRVKQQRGPPLWRLEDVSDTTLQYMSNQAYMYLCKRPNKMISKQDIFNALSEYINSDKSRHAAAAHILMVNSLNTPEKLWDHINSHLTTNCLCQGEYLRYQDNMLTIGFVPRYRLVIVDDNFPSPASELVIKYESELVDFGWNILHVITEPDPNNLGYNPGIQDIIDLLRKETVKEINITSIMDRANGLAAFSGALMALYPHQQISIISTNMRMQTILFGFIPHIYVGPEIDLPHHILTKNLEKDNLSNG